MDAGVGGGQAASQLRSSYRRARRVWPPCPVCDGERFRLIATQDRHELGLPHSICRRCAMVMIRPRPTDAWFTDFYRRYYWPTYIGNRFENPDHMYRADDCEKRAGQILDGIAGRLPRTPAACLDIGTGQGGMLVQLRRRFCSAEVHGVEPSPAGVEYCARHAGVHVLQRDWSVVRDDELAGPFTLITMIHVLEHVLDPVLCLKRAAKRLAEDGLIYIEVPNLMSERWSGAVFLHIAHPYCFTEDSLRAVCRRAGLEPVASYHGLADIWPWGVGVLAQPRRAGALTGDAIQPAPPELVESVIAHVRARIGEPTRGGWRKRGLSALRAFAQRWIYR